MFTINGRCRGREQQAGTTLIVAMVLLVVLTMIGVTALNTTTLEQRMAANTQEVNRALQAAEAALAMAFANPNQFDLNNDVPGKTGTIGDYGAGANYLVGFTRATNPPVGSLYSASKFAAYHFDIQSDGGSRVTDPGGTTALDIGDTAAVVTLHAGMYQIGPKL